MYRRSVQIYRVLKQPYFNYIYIHVLVKSYMHVESRFAKEKEREKLAPTSTTIKLYTK